MNSVTAPRDKYPTETAVVKLLALIQQTRCVSADQATALPAAKTATAATTVPNVPTGLSCVQISANQKLARRVCRQIRPVKRDLGSKNRPHIQAIPFASSANSVPKAKNATVPTEKLQTATVVVLTPIHARM